MMPSEQLEQIASQTQVDWNVSRLRGEVILSLLLFGMCRSNRLSTRVLEHLYNSSFFDCFSTKDAGHKTRHSSIAARLTSIPYEYFAADFEWALSHFAAYQPKSKRAGALDAIYRFDSTMVNISSAFVDWGMKVGRPPADGYQQLQLKVSLGMKGLFPSSLQVFFDQQHLSEEKALFEAITQASPSKKDWIVFDRGLKSREKFKLLDLKDIHFVTRGSKNTRYEVIRQHTGQASLKQLNDEHTEFVQDSVVYLYQSSNKIMEHEFRLIEIIDLKSDKKLCFITNIFDLSAQQIANIYRRRWDIEVFFRFLKQELNLKHLLSHSQNGILVQVYVTLILAILLTVFKIQNKIPGYKIAKMMFEEALLIHIVKELKLFQDDP